MGIPKPYTSEINKSASEKVESLLRRVIAAFFIVLILLFQYWFSTHIFVTNAVNGIEVDLMVIFGVGVVLLGLCYICIKTYRHFNEPYSQ